VLPELLIASPAILELLAYVAQNLLLLDSRIVVALHSLFGPMASAPANSIIVEPSLLSPCDERSSDKIP